MDTSLDIVVVEDHTTLCRVMVQLLEANGHRAVGLSCAEEVDDEAALSVPDLYLIDLNLPGEDGLSLSRRLRAAQPNVGIIMITARIEIQDRLNGYESGADHYLPKPVEPDELLATIHALTRRLRTTSHEACTVNVRDQRLRGPNGEEALQHHEVLLLSALAKAPGQSLEFWQVAQHLGQPEEHFSKTSMEVRIARLRRKLSVVSGADNPIRSVRKTGYRLCITLLIDS